MRACGGRLLTGVQLLVDFHRFGPSWLASCTPLREAVGTLSANPQAGALEGAGSLRRAVARCTAAGMSQPIALLGSADRLGIQRSAISRRFGLIGLLAESPLGEAAGPPRRTRRQRPRKPLARREGRSPCLQRLAGSRRFGQKGPLAESPPGEAAGPPRRTRRQRPRGSPASREQCLPGLQRSAISRRSGLIGLLAESPPGEVARPSQQTRRQNP